MSRKLTNYFRNATADVGVPDAFDPAKTIHRFEDVRQRGGNDHQLACAASYYTTMVPRPGASYDKAALDDANRMGVSFTYTVEKLDKGGIYVDVH